MYRGITTQILFLLVLHVLRNHLISAESTIEEMLPEKREKGMTGRLNCTVRRENGTEVIWRHGENQLELTRDDTVVVEDSLNPTVDGRKKYGVEYKEENDGRETFQLVINNVQVSDKAAYECLIQSASGEPVSKFGHLWVQIRPQLIIANTTTIVSVLWYREVELVCSVSGIPTPKVTWTRQNSEEFPEPYRGSYEVEGQKLELKRVLKEAYGVYRCTASNGIGQAVTHDALLYVESAPTVTPISEDYYYNVGAAAILECRVRGYPEMETRWRKISNETEEIVYLQAGDKYTMETTRNDSKILDEKRNATVFVSQLRIAEVEEGDLGDYECHANNKQGIATAKVSLQECTESRCDEDPASSSQLLLPVPFLTMLLVILVSLL